MKRIIISIILICFFSSAFSQAIIDRSGKGNTVQDARAMQRYNLYIPRYADSVEANLPTNIGIDSCGAVFYSYKDKAIFFRSCSPKKWVQILPSGSPSLGNAWVQRGNDLTGISGDGELGTSSYDDWYLLVNNQKFLKFSKDGIGDSLSTVVPLGIDTLTGTFSYARAGSGGGGGSYLPISDTSFMLANYWNKNDTLFKTSNCLTFDTSINPGYYTFIIDTNCLRETLGFLALPDSNVRYVTPTQLKDTAIAIRADFPTGGGSPSGNNGNLQINSSGAFGTPASDSLTWRNARQEIKGGLKVYNVGGGGTNTYATYDPATIVGSAISFSGGNLTATGVSGNFGLGWADIGKSSGSWSYEFTVGGAGGTDFYIGLANSSAAGFYLGNDANGWGFKLNTGEKVTNGSFVAYGSDCSAAGTVLTVLYSGGNLEIKKNGVSMGVMYTGLTGTLFPAVGSTNNTGSGTANFGATTFTYPEGGYNNGYYTTSGGGSDTTVSLNANSTEVRLGVPLNLDSVKYTTSIQHLVLENGEVKIDSSVAGYQYMGTLYSDSSWANLNHFNQNGGTWGTSGGAITSTGGSLSYDNSLDLDSLVSTSNGYSNLQQFREKVVLKATSSGLVGIGIRSSPTIAQINCAGLINTSTGTFYALANSAGSTSSSNLSLSLGDTIELIFERNRDVITTYVRNLTTNSAQLSVSYTYDLPTVYIPRTGRYALISASGNHNFYKIEVGSQAIRYPDVVLATDSKGLYNASYADAWTTKLQGNYEVTSSIGLGETMAEKLLLLPEYIYINPKKVILEGGSNDQIYGTVGTYASRIQEFTDSLTAHGIDINYIGPLPETAVDLTAFDSVVRYNYTTKYIDCWTPLLASGTIAGDGRHLTTYGHGITYNTTLNSFVISGAKSQPALSNLYIYASPSTTQSAYIDIDGASTIGNTLTVGNNTNLVNQLRVNTGSDAMIDVFSNSNINGIASFNLARNTVRDLDIFAAQFRVRDLSNDLLTIAATTGDLTARGKLTFTGTASQVSFNGKLDTDYHLNMYKFGTANTIESVTATRGAGRGLTIDFDDLKLRNYNAGTHQEVLNISSSNVISFPQMSATAALDTTNKKIAVLDASNNLSKMNWPTAAATVPLSGIIAATATNNVDHTTNTQTWNWTGAVAQGLILNMASTIMPNNDRVLEVNTSGANVSSSLITAAILAKNTHTGTTPVNVGLWAIGNNPIWAFGGNSAFGVTQFSPTSTLDVKGSLALSTVTKTATYTATDNDYTIICSTNTFTIDLPTAVGITGRVYVIKNITSGTTITVDGSGSETIDGATTYTLASQYKLVMIQSDGTNWNVISNN